MKYHSLKNDMFKQNRSNFASKLKPNSIAIINSNDEQLKNGDASFDFKQNSDLFYLSGVDQENTILIIYPDCPVPAFREALFVKRSNEHIEKWYGHKLSVDEARAVSGIQTIMFENEFESLIKPVIQYAENIYLNLNENDRSSNTTYYKDLRFANELKAKFPLHHYDRAAPILHRLRSIKSAYELELMKTAVGISEKMFHRLLRFVKPGVWEYEIEAEIIHEFIRNRATGHSFQPIIASGGRACILHYVDNNQQCKEGELVLIDSGADYANYASDMTRTIPVSGRFTPRQKAVYNAVLHVQREAMKLLKPGVMLMEYQKQVELICEEQLIKLGLFTSEDVKKQDAGNPLFRRYFYHGTSHFLGIDVHDVGMRYEPMKENMVFSCEPGIYIKEENIGIRLENEVLITAKGCEDLMAHIPIEADEIEQLMNN
ncbi:MAG: aminopeptidase P family protein [Bacteroidia bacterium]|nr:aminopeptidase P family protein [Bacteroidia bacterium]